MMIKYRQANRASCHTCSNKTESVKNISGAKIAPVAVSPPLPHAKGGSQGTGILRSGGQGRLEIFYHFRSY